VLRVFECYESASALDAHGASAHMREFRHAMAGWGITNLNLTRYEVTDMGALRPSGPSSD
jgi:quinol monooxygenase YgiN